MPRFGPIKREDLIYYLMLRSLLANKPFRQD